MACKLSVLICTIPERKNSFTNLFWELNKQAMGNSVQIVYDDAPRGTITIGAKRNLLLNKAMGDYVCFVIWTVEPAQLPRRRDFFSLQQHCNPSS